MPVSDLIQNAFTSGELDPKLRSRFDIATYYSGAAKIRNALIRPQGAVIRRPGFKYIGEVSTGNIKMFPFSFSKEHTYTLILSENLMSIYKEGVLQDTVVCTIADAIIPDITSAQANDTILLFHEDLAPIAFVRENPTTWHTYEWEIQNPPTERDDSIITPDRDCQILESARTNFDFSLWVPGNDATNAIFELKTGTDIWPANVVGKFIRGPLGGYAKVTTRVSDTELLATILAPFTNDITDDRTILTAGEYYFEDETWSAAKGYPRCGTFFQGRLWMAGTVSRPSTIWASRTNNEHDFRNWVPTFADDGIEASAGGNQARFNRLFAGQHLFIFADEGEYYIPISFDEPLVPTNISIKRNSAYGCEPKIDAIELGGSLIFLRKGGKSLIESTFNFAAGNYQHRDLNLLASHVLNDPVSLAYRKHTSVDDSDYIFIINADGTMSVLCTLREQDVNGWTVQHTTGNMIATMTENEFVYVVVDRVIDGIPVRMLETLDFDVFHDAGVLKEDATPFTTVSGLNHLIGEEVTITLDNTIQPAQTVGVTGTITLARPGYYCSVGLPFPTVDEDGKYQVYIESMPIQIEGEWGTSVMRKKRIVEVMAMLYETSHVVLNKNKVTIRRLGITHLDEPLPLITKNISIKGVRGWDEEIVVTAGQEQALPMQILSLAYRVKV